jgi:hypothetical protein
LMTNIGWPSAFPASRNCSAIFWKDSRLPRAVFGCVRPSCRTVNRARIGCSPRPEHFGEDVGKCVKTLISLGFTAKHVSRSLAKNAAATGYAQYSTHPSDGEMVARNRKPL